MKNRCHNSVTVRYGQENSHPPAHPRGGDGAVGQGGGEGV